MTKKIFEGTINGQVYKTVEEYNAAINKALESGVPIEARTTTRVEVVENPDINFRAEVAEEPKNIDYHNFEGKDLLPEVDLDHLENVPQPQDFDDKLWIASKSWLNLLEKLSRDQLKELQQAVLEMLNANKERKKTSERAAAVVQERLNVLHRALDYSDSLVDYYDEFLVAINEELQKFKNPTTTPKKESKKMTQEDRVRSLLDSLGLL